MLGWIIFGGRTEEQRRQRLFDKVDELLETAHLPRALKDAGVVEDEFERALPAPAHAAFSDPSIRTNRRMPLIREIVDPGRDRLARRTGPRPQIAR